MAPPPALQKVQDRLLLQVVQSPLRTAVISTMFPLGDCGAVSPPAYADYNAIRPVKRSINLQDRKKSVDKRSIHVFPGFSGLPISGLGGPESVALSYVGARFRQAWEERCRS